MEETKNSPQHMDGEIATMGIGNKDDKPIDKSEYREDSRYEQVVGRNA